jgi:Bacterial regulatory protein, arsR family
VVAESLDALTSEFFRSPAHKARNRILELLVTGDRPVTELLPDVAVKASNLSQQLAALERSTVEMS